MAKNFKSSLPKVISRANRDISTIIENDIAKESALLKDLVDQVLKANLEVKKKNNLRITETKRKLAELDTQIEDLNVKIDLVDRETVIQQLNEMIDAENKIFNARQEIRFFDNEQLPERIITLDGIYEKLTSTIKNVNESEEQYRQTLLENNELLINKQLEVTNEITHAMDEAFTNKADIIKETMANLGTLNNEIMDTEAKLNNILASTIIETNDIITESGNYFTDIDDDSILFERMNEEHLTNLSNIEERESKLQDNYETTKQDIIDTYLVFEDSIKSKLEDSNKDVLSLERSEKDDLDSQVKSKKLQIMHFTQKGLYEKAEALMKEVTKLEKSKKSTTTKKVSKQANVSTKKQKDKAIIELNKNEINFITDKHDIAYQKAYEAIRYEEAKILYKIQLDFDGLNKSLDDNKAIGKAIKEFLNDKVLISKQVFDLKLQFRLAELDLMKENEYLELELIDIFKELLLSIKIVEEKRNQILNQSNSGHKLMQIEHDYKLQRAIEDIKFNQETSDIDKLILKKRNETIIKNEKLKEELNSEVIYQESLVNIAQKEHELQLIKVTSLYENERGLAEEQVERINLGIQVNDTFVKTTLQNQLLFAEQQISCADSEFDIRVESINLTHDQEVQYANKKIEYYRQKYEYEKNKIRKELDDKLEDLKYKLLLFTDEKDNKEISEKINGLKDHYEGLIDEIESTENNDEEILRYEKVINDAANRQSLAINEAAALKEQTVESFTSLYDATKQKFDQIKDTNQTPETSGITPLLNNSAIASADERLKQATKEADGLFNERINGPKKIIEETKLQIQALTNSDESDKFIDEQRQLKYELLRLHQEKVKKLTEDKVLESAPLLKELETDLNEISPQVVIDETIFKDKEYRKKEDIFNDYKILSQKEKDLLKSMLTELDTNKKSRLLLIDKSIKESNNLLKLTTKPYKKYMKQAGKGTNAQKRSLKKVWDKKLNKLIKETEKGLKETPII